MISACEWRSNGRVPACRARALAADAGFGTAVSWPYREARLHLYHRDAAPIPFAILNPGISELEWCNAKAVLAMKELGLKIELS